MMMSTEPRYKDSGGINASDYSNLLNPVLENARLF